MQSLHIYQAFFRLFFGVLSIIVFTGLFLFGAWSMINLGSTPFLQAISHIQDFVEAKNISTFYGLAGMWLFGIFFMIRWLLMLFSVGNPIATLTHEGVMGRSGKIIPWDIIEDISIESVSYIWITLRSDMVLYLESGKRKKIPYVKVSQETLQNMLEELDKK